METLTLTYDQLDTIREALAFYGNRDTYEDDTDGAPDAGPGILPIHHEDNFGDQARAALEILKGITEGA